MVVVEICVGSSCHLKGAEAIVKLMEDAVAANHLEDEVALTGSFCTGKCNRIGVTVTVNDTTYTGITPEGFRDFWNDRVMSAVEKERG